jgi:hypothetical protein
LAKYFEEHQAPAIVIPPVLDSTMRASVTSERKLKRYLPLHEASNHPELSDINRVKRSYRAGRQLTTHNLRSLFL